MIHFFIKRHSELHLTHDRQENHTSDCGHHDETDNQNADTS